MQVMKCTATLIGKAPLQFGKAITSIKDPKEKHDKFEERTWRERMHVGTDGIVFIPAMALKLCLEESAGYVSEKIAGKGNATYTKRFRSGIMVVQNLSLGIKAADVQPNRLFVPSDGKRGGPKRVWKMFPTVPEWETECEIMVLDRLLMDDVVKVREYLEHGGDFVGMCSFRPANGGYFGRFDVKNWKVDAP